jgi:predicted MFS family arabinose efflux permease
LLLLSCALSLFGWPTLTLLPALAKLQLHAQEGVYGTLLSATGGGALVASLLVATFSSRGWQRGFLVGGVLLTATALAGLSMTSNVLSAAACCTLFGTGLILFFPTAQSIMQLSATDQNRGVIMGIWSMILGGAVPLGGLIAGEAADRWGVPDVLAAEAVCVVLSASFIGAAAIVFGRRRSVLGG